MLKVRRADRRGLIAVGAGVHLADAVQVREHSLAIGADRPHHAVQQTRDRRRVQPVVVGPDPSAARERVAGELAHVELVLVLLERRPVTARQRRGACGATDWQAPCGDDHSLVLGLGSPIAEHVRQGLARVTACAQSQAERGVPSPGRARTRLDQRIELNSFALQRRLPRLEVGLRRRRSEQQDAEVDPRRRCCRGGGSRRHHQHGNGCKQRAEHGDRAGDPSAGQHTSTAVAHAIRRCHQKPPTSVQAVVVFLQGPGKCPQAHPGTVDDSRVTGNKSGCFAVHP